MRDVYAKIAEYVIRKTLKKIDIKDLLTPEEEKELAAECADALLARIFPEEGASTE